MNITSIRPYFSSALQKNKMLYVAYGVVFSFVYSTPIFPGIILQHFFDTLQIGELGNVQLLVTLLFVFGLVRAVAIVSGLFLEVTLRNRVATKIRLGVSKSILSVSALKSSRQNSGNVLPVIRDDVDTAEDVFALSVDILGMSLFIFGTFYILLGVDVLLTLIVFLPLTVIVIAVQVLSNRLQNVREDNRVATEKTTGFVYSSLEAIDQIKTSALSNIIGRRYKDLSNRRSVAAIKDTMLGVGLDTFYASIVTIGTASILILSASKILDGSFTIGDFAIFVYFLGFITDFTKLFGEFTTSLSQSNVSLERLTSLSPTGTIKGIFQEDYTKATLEVRELSFNKTGSPIDGLEIKSGELLVISGKTGSGKSVLLDKLIGLNISDRHYSLDGRNYHTGLINKANVAYSPQVFSVFEGDLIDSFNVNGTEELNQLLSRAGFNKNEIDHLEKSEVKNESFSGGQLRRLSNASGFLPNIDIAFYDNPTASLDKKTKDKVRDNLLENSAIKIVVTNDKELISAARHHITLG